MATIRIPLKSRKYPDATLLIDETDIDLVRRYQLFVSPGRHTLYVGAYPKGADSRVSKTRLHRLIMDPPPGMVVDHINGDGLDNRRCNLRIATYGQNNINQKVRKDSRSGLKGVYRHFCRGKYGRWVAHIDRRHLGMFDTAEDAARAYDAEAIRIHGEFAKLNFPTESRGTS